MINPILVLVLIPVFQFVIYPAVNVVFQMTPIRKISIGFFLAAASFGVIMLAQQRIDGGATPSIAWQLWAYVLLTGAEVMISITGLEFSYTQAPRKMKSVVMALWLFSVSLGNFFASTVNHQIQVDGVGQVAKAVKNIDSGEGQTGSWKYRVAPTSQTSSRPSIEKPKGDESPGGKVLRLAGFDGAFDSEDDVLLSFDKRNSLSNVATSENEGLEAAAALIDKAFFDSSPTTPQLPSEQAGNQLIKDLEDSRGNPYFYKLVSRNNYRITSTGGDEVMATQWDVILQGTVQRASPMSDDQLNAPYNWLERRIIELKGEEGKAEVDAERGDIPETVVKHDITVGGQDTLEGADYFRFWMITMGITALLFVPVGYFYKEKSYIQDESDDA